MSIEAFLVVLVGTAFCGFSLYLLVQAPHVYKEQKRYDMHASATVTGNIQDTKSWMYHPVLSYHANGTAHVVTCKKGFAKPIAEGVSIAILYASENPNEMRIAERAPALKFCLALAFLFLIGLRILLGGFSMLS